MAQRLSTPDRLFERSWRPGHPYAPRLSRGRRWTMFATLVLLSTIIGGYWYLTDSVRVRAMLRGKLEASGIRAIDPHVRLTENLDTRRWNYQRMVRRPTTRPNQPTMQNVVLPEIILRNAQIDYSEIRNRKFISLGSMAIE